MRFSTLNTIFALATLSNAQFTPQGSAPSGNAIGHPELGELMTAGSPFTITWTPSTQDNVSLILLQGPSTNVIPIMTIVASTANNGSYTWDVPTSLSPASTGYGIELVDSNGDFQYSPQCGIANNQYADSSSVSGSTISSTNYITMTLSTGANYTGPVASPTTFASVTGNLNGTVITPTNSMTVPSTLSSTVVVTPTEGTTFFSATPSAQPTQKGAAVAQTAGLGLVGAAGLFAVLLL